MLAQETFESKPSDLPAVVFCSTTTPRDQLRHLLNNKSRNIHASSTNDQKKFYICFSPLGRQLRKLSDVICLQNVMFNISKVVWAQMFICRAQTCTNEAQRIETDLDRFGHYWGAEWKKWNLNNLKIKRAQMFICRAQTMHKWLRHIWTDSDNIGVLSDVICFQNVMFDISKTEWAQIFICRAQTCTNEAQMIWNSFTFFFTHGVPTSRRS